MGLDDDVVVPAGEEAAGATADDGVGVVEHQPGWFGAAELAGGVAEDPPGLVRERDGVAGASPPTRATPATRTPVTCSPPSSSARTPPTGVVAVDQHAPRVGVADGEGERVAELELWRRRSVAPTSTRPAPRGRPVFKRTLCGS